MKLLYCPMCKDVFALGYKERICKCGVCKGKYPTPNKLMVEPSNAIILSIEDKSLYGVVEKLPFIHDGLYLNIHVNMKENL